MPLSRDYNFIQFYREAAQDLQGAQGIPRHTQHDLGNRAIQTVVGQFYDLMSQSYMTETPICDVTLGKYQTGTSGSYVVSTKTLTLDTPNVNISSNDIGKYVGWRMGSSLYLGTINTNYSTTAVILNDGDLPPSDGTVQEVHIYGTANMDGSISLSSLRIMRTGANIRTELSSSDKTITIKAGSIKEVERFSGVGGESKTIVWAFNGDNIDFSMGNSLTSTGSLIVRYPRLPEKIISDTQKIDIPDGTAIEIAIIYLRGLLQQRLFGKKEDNAHIIQPLIANLYATYNREASDKVVVEKVLALK